MSDLSMFAAFDAALERIAPTRPRLRGTSMESAVVTIEGIPFACEYVYTAPFPDTRWEPGHDAEVQLQACEVDGHDLMLFLESSQIAAIEAELLRLTPARGKHQ